VTGLKPKSLEFERATVDEFEAMLADKPESEVWELIGGRVVRGMVGARIEHQRIIGNIDFALKHHFRRARMPCESLRETFWLKARMLELEVFPDVMVHCGAIAPGATSIDSPQILFEVSSRESDHRDRFEKGDLYRQLPSLHQYVIVQRDRVHIDILSRTGTGGWSATMAERGGTLALPSIDLQLAVADIYQGVFETGGSTT
jgi:Uma2 family endonuclease